MVYENCKLFQTRLGHVKLIIWFSDTDFKKNDEGGRVFNFYIYMHIDLIFRFQRCLCWQSCFAQILYSSSIRYFHNKPRVMTWNPVKNGHRNQLWFHFIDCYHSELPEVTTSYNQRKTQECSEFIQREIGVVPLC